MTTGTVVEVDVVVAGGWAALAVGCALLPHAAASIVVNAVSAIFFIKKVALHAGFYDLVAAKVPAVVLDSGRIVTLAVPDGVARELVPHFNTRVRAEVEETVTHEKASGRERVRFQLLSVVAAEANQLGDDPITDSTVE